MSEEIKPGNLPEEPRASTYASTLPKKNPRRVEAGKKGAEAKRIRALLRKKELEEIKEENQRLHMKEPVLSVTKEPVPLPEHSGRPGIKLPALWISAGIIGSIGLIVASYFFRRKPIKPRPIKKPVEKPGNLPGNLAGNLPEIDPFEF